MPACSRWVSGTDRQTDRPLPPLQLPGMEVQGALQDGAHHRQGAPGTAQPGGTGTRWRQRGHPERPPSMCRGRWHRVSAAVRPPLISVQAGARFPVTCCPPGPGPRGGRRGGGVSVWDLDLQPSHLTRLCVLRCPHPNHHCTPTTIVPRSRLHSLQILPLPISAVITSDCCRGNARGAFPLQAGAVTLIPIFPLGNRADVPVQTCVGFFCVRAHRCAFSSRLCTPVRLLQPFAEMLLSVRSLMSRHGGVN